MAITSLRILRLKPHRIRFYNVTHRIAFGKQQMDNCGHREFTPLPHMAVFSAGWLTTDQTIRRS